MERMLNRRKSDLKQVWMKRDREISVEKVSNEKKWDRYQIRIDSVWKKISNENKPIHFSWKHPRQIYGINSICNEKRLERTLNTKQLKIHLKTEPKTFCLKKALILTKQIIREMLLQVLTTQTKEAKKLTDHLSRKVHRLTKELTMLDKEDEKERENGEGGEGNDPQEASRALATANDSMKAEVQRLKDENKVLTSQNQRTQQELQDTRRRSQQECKRFVMLIHKQRTLGELCGQARDQLECAKRVHLPLWIDLNVITACNVQWCTEICDSYWFKLHKLTLPITHRNVM